MTIYVCMIICLFVYVRNLNVYIFLSYMQTFLSRFFIFLCTVYNYSTHIVKIARSKCDFIVKYDFHYKFVGRTLHFNNKYEVVHCQG